LVALSVLAVVAAGLGWYWLNRPGSAFVGTWVNVTQADDQVIIKRGSGAFEVRYAGEFHQMQLEQQQLRNAGATLVFELSADGQTLWFPIFDDIRREYRKAVSDQGTP
jgi:hypothetical protein